MRASVCGLSHHISKANELASDDFEEIRMKLEILATTAILSTMCLATPVKAENPAHVRQLLETGECAACDLTKANLRGAHLIGADLRNADLTGADLKTANLEGADLTGANLKGANLTKVLASDASLNYANLTGVNFAGAKLYSTEMKGATLADNNFSGAKLYSANYPM